MSSLALSLKYRPKLFSDLVGQETISQTLSMALDKDRIVHAYLFSGLRGSGKTSSARIFARALECEKGPTSTPCGECAICLATLDGRNIDIIEMDAASNRSIDSVRDLIEQTKYVPTMSRFKIFIIDEVHMLTKEAFNALLKTLEEPPEYVIFILATTEYHKLPTTIVSRCQRFDFKRISSDVIVKRLFEIANAEGIKLTEDAARVIARVSRGGMRDAISLLELCAGAHKEIDERLVFDTVGSGNRESAYKIARAVGEADFDTVYSIIDDIVMKSGDLSVFWQEIIDTYRDMLVLKNSKNAKKYLDLTDMEYSAISEIVKSFTMARLTYHITILESAMADMQRAFNSKRSIAEIALTRMCDPKTVSSIEALTLRVEELEKKISMIELGVPVAPKREAKATPKAKEETPKESVESATKSKNIVKKDDKVEQNYDSWDYILERISALKHSLKSGLSSAKVTRAGDSFTIYLNQIFYKILSANTNDVELIRGLIAEKEKKSRDSIAIELRVAENKKASAFADFDEF